MISAEELKRVVRRLEIKARRALSGSLAGFARSAAIGRGLAFEEVRAYLPSDDVRDIDWKVTARRGEPYVKTFSEEREQTVWIVVDLGPGMRFGSGPATKLDIALEAAALIVFWSAYHGDRAGLVTFGDRNRLVLPRRGERHALRILRDLVAAANDAERAFTQSLDKKVDPHQKNRGVTLAEAVARVASIRPRRAMSFVISDFLFDEPAAPFRDLLSRHHSYALCVADPWELELPDVGLVRFRDPGTGESTIVDTSNRAYREAYAKQSHERQQRLVRQFRQINVEPVSLLTHRTAVDSFRRAFGA